MVSADRSCTYLQLRCGPSSCAPRAAANRTAQLPCSMYPRRSSQCALARQPTRLAAPATAPPARAPAPDNAPLPLPLSSRPPPTLPPGQGLKTPVRAASAQASAASLSGKYRFAQSGKAAALARVTAAMRSSCTGKTASRARMCASAIRTSVRSVDADALQVRGGREGGGGCRRWVSAAAPMSRVQNAAALEDGRYKQACWQQQLPGKSLPSRLPQDVPARSAWR